MKLVHATPDRLLLGHLRNILDSEGIPHETRRDTLSAVAGDVPAQETWAELWVDEAHAARAAELIAEVLRAAPQASGPQWTCRCGERHDDTFDACWSCGSVRETA